MFDPTAVSKVIEECPSPINMPGFVNEWVKRRSELRRPSIVGAGTVEFLFSDATREFYFLEMNTRLQVEHPVTELVTGFDLVREQINVAAGGALSFTQSDVRWHGHAIECRVYAEDPANNFFPSPGTISYLRVPAGPGIRDDSGVTEGDEVSIFYDPMISKLASWGLTRAEAIDRLRRALDEYAVGGIRRRCLSSGPSSARRVHCRPADTDSFLASRTSRARRRPVGVTADITSSRPRWPMLGSTKIDESSAATGQQVENVAEHSLWPRRKKRRLGLTNEISWRFRRRGGTFGRRHPSIRGGG